MPLLPLSVCVVYEWLLCVSVTIFGKSRPRLLAKNYGYFVVWKTTTNFQPLLKRARVFNIKLPSKNVINIHKCVSCLVSHTYYSLPRFQILFFTLHCGQYLKLVSKIFQVVRQISILVTNENDRICSLQFWSRLL